MSPPLPPVDWSAHETYATAPRECDLVLEGGIAGGVVYPRAVLEIARTHRLRNVGGASAGAIAVALAAAAEFGRAHGLTGPAEGFPGLAAVDAELRRPGVLRGLFEPHADARPLLEFVVRLFGAKAVGLDEPPEKAGRLQPDDDWFLRWGKKWRRARPWLLALRSFERGHAVGGLAGGALAAALAAPLVVWLAATGAPLGLATALVLALGAFMAGAFLGGVLGAVDEAFTLVDVHLQPGNSFGVCTGTHRGRDRRGEALFDWLHRHVQTLSGRGLDAPPLTFDDLANLPDRATVLARMVTTNLNAQRAHRVPFDDGELLIYRRADLRPLLPPPVFAALEATAGTPPPGFEHLRLPAGGAFGWFPVGGRLPLVVGVRLSMSFPLLFAAVRLYMVKSVASAPPPGAPRELSPERDLVECWFSDGGICNNFPLQVFDTWFPERPTFGINLSDAPVAGSALRAPGPVASAAACVEHRGTEDERRDDWVPHELRGAGDFLSALAETLLSHRDNALMRLAGYRERVATVRLNAGEGSLHIDMPPSLVDALGERGRFAAARLTALDLDGHQWVRLRTLLGALENEVLRMQRYRASRDTVVAGPGAGLDSLRADWMRLIHRAGAAEGTPDALYPSMAPGRRPSPEEVETWYSVFVDRADALLSLMERWTPPEGQGTEPFLDAGRETSTAPQPRGEHRITSKI